MTRPATLQTGDRQRQDVDECNLQVNKGHDSESLIGDDD